MNKIRAVLFDMDGLLIDTESQNLRAAQEIGREMGFEIHIPTVARAVLGTRREVVVAAYGSVLPEGTDAADFYERKNKRVREIRAREGIRPCKGAPELLKWLTDHRIPCVLATSTRSELVETCLKEAGLAQYFDLRITGSMVQNGKPHPETYLKAASLAGVPAEDCLVLEDGFLGLQAGRASGAVVGMVPDTLPYDALCEPYTDQVFESLLDVISWLEKE